MQRTSFATLTAVASFVAISAAVAAPTHFTGQGLAGRAKVDLAHARAIALKARPGKIADQELEKEAGGSGLRYSFDIKSAGKTYEVGVDAVTGRILENGGESAAKEAAEVKSEGAAHRKAEASEAHGARK